LHFIGSDAVEKVPLQSRESRFPQREHLHYDASNKVPYLIETRLSLNLNSSCLRFDLG